MLAPRYATQNKREEKTETQLLRVAKGYGANKEHTLSTAFLESFGWRWVERIGRFLDLLALGNQSWSDRNVNPPQLSVYQEQNLVSILEGYWIHPF